MSELVNDQVNARQWWGKRAIAQLYHNKEKGFCIELSGPGDGSGCAKAGEKIVHRTSWTSTSQKAMSEAIEFADGKQIRIEDWDMGIYY